MLDVRILQALRKGWRNVRSVQAKEEAGRIVKDLEMVTCPKCMRWISGDKYAEWPKLCYECGAELPDSLRSTLDGERKASLVQAENKNATWSTDKGWAAGLICASVACLALGFYQIYGKIDSSAKIVGGDAYDYIIYGERGLAWIGAGLVCAVLACAFLLFELLNRRAS
jgi:hypothetical protein